MSEVHCHFCGETISVDEEIARWAEGIIKDVYEEWKSRFSRWEQGFKVFQGWVHMERPSVLIVPLNPGNPGGRGEESWAEDESRYS